MILPASSPASSRFSVFAAAGAPPAPSCPAGALLSAPPAPHPGRLLEPHDPCVTLPKEAGLVRLLRPALLLLRGRGGAPRLPRATARARARGRAATGHFSTTLPSVSASVLTARRSASRLRRSRASRAAVSEPFRNAVERRRVRGRPAKLRVHGIQLRLPGGRLLRTARAHRPSRTTRRAPSRTPWPTSSAFPCSSRVPRPADPTGGTRGPVPSSPFPGTGPRKLRRFPGPRGAGCRKSRRSTPAPRRRNDSSVRPSMDCRVMSTCSIVPGRAGSSSASFSRTFSSSPKVAAALQLQLREGRGAPPAAHEPCLGSLEKLQVHADVVPAGDRKVRVDLLLPLPLGQVRGDEQGQAHRVEHGGLARLVGPEHDVQSRGELQELLRERRRRAAGTACRASRLQLLEEIVGDLQRFLVVLPGQLGQQRVGKGPGRVLAVDGLRGDLLPQLVRAKVHVKERGGKAGLQGVDLVQGFARARAR